MRKAFEFVKIRDLPEKPRKAGIIEFRGPYYTPVTHDYLKGILADWSEYVDGLKFAGGSMRLLPYSTVKKMISMCHDHGVYVSTGGFIERVVAEGERAVDRYIEECKALGYDVIEVSNGLAPIKLEDKVEMVKAVIDAGLKPKPEVTMMIGAGAGTHIANYEESMKMKKVEDAIKEVEMHLRAGAKILMLESEGLTEDLPEKEWKTDIIRKLINRFGKDVWMFEAADPPVFKWYLKNFGKDVNLFIDHSQIVELNAWRLGLWGDRDIWKGKSVAYSRKGHGKRA